MLHLNPAFVTMSSVQRALNVTGDSVSAAAIMGTIFGYLPGIAALAAVVWYAVQIWESKTIQKWVRVRRMHARLKRIARQG